jgi:hypothetical protein
VVYSAWVSPFEFGFIRKPEGPLAIIDNVVNAFFAVDIILTFFVAYLDRMTYLLEDDPKRIAWRYTTSWFVLDVASTVPTEFARRILPPNLRSYGFFNMLRLWRLRRVSSLFARYVKWWYKYIRKSILFLYFIENLIRYYSIYQYELQFHAFVLLLRITSAFVHFYDSFFRLEKDRDFNYFWVRCAKLICVSNQDI